jgi:hypothetical protein
MSRQIQLNIADPCSENWDNMEQSEKGRYCQACQKQVIDFTGMTETQLALFFKNNQSAVCGRLRKDQVEKELHIPRKRIHWFRYFLQVALPAVIFSSKAYAQGKVMVKPTTVLQEERDSINKKMASVNSSSRYRMITGKVVGTDGKPVAFAQVWTPGRFESAASDSNGNFRLIVEKEDTDIHIEVSGIGYTPRTIDLKLDGPVSHSVITLQPDAWAGEMIYLGGITSVRVSKKEKKLRAHKTTPEKIIQPVMDTTHKVFKVYPNPVVSGSSLNLELTRELNEGYYNLDISAVNGNSVFQQTQMWIDKEARVMNVQIPAIAPGNYILSLRSRKDGRVYSQVIVVN